MTTVNTPDTGDTAFTLRRNAPWARRRTGRTGLRALLATIRKRRARNRAYRDLLALNDHLLDDIGLTYGQIARAWAAGHEPDTLVRRNPLWTATRP